MPIKYNYEVSVSDNKANLNKDIFLFSGNRNIHYYFSIKGARFTFSKENEDLLESSNAIYAAVTVVKPNGVEVANAIAPVEDGLIHLKVTEDLIDEEVEVGDFDLVFDLFDDNEGAVTIPKIKGQFHVQERPCTTSIGTLSGNVNVVNQAVVDLAIATQENEQLIVVDDDGKYVKTTWVKGDKISVERLNKIEEGIEKNSTQYKDIANKTIIEGNKLYLVKSDGTKLDEGTDLPTNGSAPTQEQINTAINKAIEDGLISGSGTKTSITESDTFAIGASSSGGNTPTQPTARTIVNTLSNCTTKNTSTTINEKDSYTATLTPNEGYVLGKITVIMGGVDVSSTVVNNNVITISNVTGNIVITCSGKKNFNLSDYIKTAGYYVGMKSIQYSTVRFTAGAEYNVYSIPIKANTRYKITVEDTDQYQGYITKGAKLGSGNTVNMLAILDKDVTAGDTEVMMDVTITEPEYEYAGVTKNGDIYIFTGYATYSTNGYLAIGLNPSKNPVIEEAE